MSDDESKYAIGYKRLPAHRRFKKGHSGNPRGRPKGSKNLKTILAKVLEEKVTITDNGRRRKISRRELLTRQLVAKALGGDLRAMQVIISTSQVQQEPGVNTVRFVYVDEHDRNA